MKILSFESEQEWLAARLGKITGSRLKDVTPKERGSGKKKGFYELVAERIALPADGENPMERGHRLESEAIERFETVTGKKVDPSLIMWAREDDDRIAISPDGVIGKTGIEAVEVKCLASASHVEALLTKQVPSEYKYQTLQYFIVNDVLETLHLCFYDPRLRVHDFFIIEVTRESVKDEIDAMLEHQKLTLVEVDEIVKQLSF